MYLFGIKVNRYLSEEYEFLFDIAAVNGGKYYVHFDQA